MQSSEDLLRLLLSILTVLGPFAIGRRKYIGKALMKAGRLLDRVSKDKPLEEEGLPTAMRSENMAQNIALKSIDERIDNMGDRLRRGLDGLQQQINEERNHRRSEYADLKAGMNNLSVRVYDLEHPKSVTPEANEG